MKKYLTTIIALIVIAVLLSGFFIAKKAGWLDPKPTATNDPYADIETGPVFAFFTTDENAFSKISEIESVNAGEALVHVKSNSSETA